MYSPKFGVSGSERAGDATQRMFFYFYFKIKGLKKRNRETEKPRNRETEKPRNREKTKPPKNGIQMRFFPRPLLDVVGLGSAHGAQELSTSARLAKVAPTAPAPTDYSRVKSAAVGAAVGAALSGATIVGGALAKAVKETAEIRDRVIAKLRDDESLSHEQAVNIFDERRAVYLLNEAADAAKKAVRPTVAAAIGGGAAGFAAGSLIDRAARAKFGTSDADLEHRKPRGAVGVRRPFV